MKMKMKKRTTLRLLSLLLVLLLTAAFAGCSAGSDSSSQSASDSSGASGSSSQSASASQDSSSGGESGPVINVAALKGPTGMGMVKLMQDNEDGVSANRYNFTIASAPEEVATMLTSGEVDIAALPSNLGANLYQKTEGKVKMAATNILGILYIMEKGDSIQSVADLKGKTIVTSGQGSTPEYALNYILEQNGIDPQTDVTIEYKSEHSEVATLALAGQADVIMVPQPFVTQIASKDESFRTALDISAEWESLTGQELSMGALVVRTAFLEENQEAFDRFLEEYQRSTEFINDSPEEGAALVEKYDIMAADVAQKAIPSCNIVFIAGEDMKSSTAAFLEILYNANPASVGGALPDDDFYYIS